MGNSYIVIKVEGIPKETDTIGQLIILNMSILPILTCSFSAFPIKNPNRFILWYFLQLILKLNENSKGRN